MAVDWCVAPYTLLSRGGLIVCGSRSFFINRIWISKALSSTRHNCTPNSSLLVSDRNWRALLLVRHSAIHGRNGSDTKKIHVLSGYTHLPCTWYVHLHPKNGKWRLTVN